MARGGRPDLLAVHAVPVRAPAHLGGIWLLHLACHDDASPNVHNGAHCNHQPMYMINKMSIYCMLAAKT